eukprot:7475316-Pyramimonas_sp.AAC.1
MRQHAGASSVATECGFGGVGVGMLSSMIARAPFCSPGWNLGGKRRGLSCSRVCVQELLTLVPYAKAKGAYLVALTSNPERCDTDPADEFHLFYPRCAHPLLLGGVNVALFLKRFAQHPEFRCSLSQLGPMVLRSTLATVSDFHVTLPLKNE